MTEQDKKKLDQAQVLISAFLQGKKVQWRSYYARVEDESSWHTVEHPKGLFRFLSDGDDLRIAPESVEETSKFKNELELYACPGQHHHNLTVVVLSEAAANNNYIFWVVSNNERKTRENKTITYGALTGEHKVPYKSRAEAIDFAKLLAKLYIDTCNKPNKEKT